MGIRVNSKECPICRRFNCDVPNHHERVRVGVKIPSDFKPRPENPRDRIERVNRDAREKHRP
jgi:hypothetical protein